MRVIRSIQFDADDRATFRGPANIIGIAYPNDDDPLTEHGTVVPNDDPHRRVLAGFVRSANGTVRYSLILLAEETLTTLLAAVRSEADPQHWAAAAPAQVAVMVEVRSVQVGQVEAALAVVRNALSRLDEADDANAMHSAPTDAAIENRDLHWRWRIEGIASDLHFAGDLDAEKAIRRRLRPSETVGA